MRGKLRKWKTVVVILTVIFAGFSAFFVMQPTAEAATNDPSPSIVDYSFSYDTPTTGDDLPLYYSFMPYVEGRTYGPIEVYVNWTTDQRTEWTNWSSGDYEMYNIDTYSSYGDGTYINLETDPIAPDAYEIEYQLSVVDDGGHWNTTHNTVAVQDDDDPVMKETFPSGGPMRGQDHNVTVNLTDNREVGSPAAGLDYTIDYEKAPSESQSGIAMTSHSGTLYSENISLNNTVTNLTYTITGNDAAGNSVTINRDYQRGLGPKVVDKTVGQPKTGRNYNIDWAIVNQFNDVNSANLDWRMERVSGNDTGGNPINEIDNQTMMIPEDATRLTYWLNATDVNGNQTSEQTSQAVQDVIPPEVVIDGPDRKKCTVGKNYTWEVKSYSDNIGVNQLQWKLYDINILYHYFGSDPTNSMATSYGVDRTLVSETGESATGKIDLGDNDPYKLALIASDDAGNENYDQDDAFGYNYVNLTVQDSTSDPIDGANMTLTVGDREIESNGTDPMGLTKFYEPFNQTKNISLTVNHPDYDKDSPYVFSGERDKGGYDKTITIFSQSEWPIILGPVTDSQGYAIPNANMTLSDGTDSWKARTGPKGYAVIELPHNPYRSTYSLTIERSSYETFTNDSFEVPSYWDRAKLISDYDYILQENYTNLHPGDYGVEKGQYIDSMTVEARESRDKGLADTAHQDIDMFLQGVESHEYENTPENWRQNLTESKGVGSYTNLFHNPVYQKDLPTKTDEHGYEGVQPIVKTNSGEWRFNPLANRSIRFATNFLINRNHVCNEFYDGHANPRYSPIGPNEPGHESYIEPVEEEIGLSATGNHSRGFEMIQNSMDFWVGNLSEGELRNDGTDADPQWQYRPPGGTWENITIEGMIRTEDKRKEIGQYYADLLEASGFEVEKELRTRKKAVISTFYSDPKDLSWQFYTGGWLASQATKYKYWSMSQMYAPYYTYMPGMQDKNNWNYENERLDKLGKKLEQGKINSEDEYWETLQKMDRIGIHEGVRVFISDVHVSYPSNRHSMRRSAPDRTTGYSNSFTPQTMRSDDGDMNIATFSSNGELVTGSWNWIEGVSGQSTEKLQQISYDEPVMNHPRTGEPMEMRADFNVTADYHWSGGSLTENITVPSDGVYYDTLDERWKTVGSGLKAATKVTFDWHLDDIPQHYHDGHEITEKDIIAHYAFKKDKSYLGADNDQKYNRHLGTSEQEFFNNIEAIDWGGDDGKFTIYGDYTFPTDEVIADYYAIGPGRKPWQIDEAADHCVRGTGYASTTEVYSWGPEGSANWVDFLNSSHSQDFTNTMQNLQNDNWVPNYLNETNNSGVLNSSLLYSYTDYSSLDNQIESIQQFYSDHGHLWDSQGPFMLTDYDKNAHTMHFQRFTKTNGYRYNKSYWNDFLRNQTFEAVNVEAPEFVVQGEDIPITSYGKIKEDYPVRSIYEADRGNVTIQLLDSGGDIMYESYATLQSGGRFTLTIPGSVTSGVSGGYYTIRSIGKLPEDDTTSVVTTSIYVNSEPNAPTNPTPGDGATGVVNNPILEVDVSDPDGDSMDVSFYNASDDSLIGSDSGVPHGGTASISWSTLREGQTYTWYTIADDGYVTTRSPTWSFTVENIDPTITIDSPAEDSIISSSSVPVSWTANDEYAGIDHYEIRLNRGWENVGSSSSYTLSPVHDGQHRLDVKAIDNVGNTKSDTKNFTVDSTAPMVLTTSPTQGSYVGSSSVTVEWGGGDQTTGIDHYEVRIGSQSWTVVDSNSHTFSELSEGSHTVEVKAVDGAGNSNTDTVTFTVDTTAPSVSIDSPSAGTNTKDSSMTVEWSGSDATSGLDHYEVRLGRGEWENVNTSSSYTFSSLSDGEYSVEVKAVDNTSNSKIKMVSFTRDTTAPEADIISPYMDAEIEDDSVTVVWTGDDEIVGVDHYEIKLDDGEWKDVGKDTSYTFEDVSKGSHSIEVRAVDTAGNTVTKSVSFSVTEEREPKASEGILGTYWWLILIIIVVAAAIGIVAYMKSRP